MTVREWGSAVVLLGAFVAAVGLPDHRGDGTYYAAGRLLLQGDAGPRMYDDAWMGERIEAATGGRVSDIFTPNSPTAALIALPVAWLAPEAARRAWAAINATWLLASLACLLRLNRGSMAAPVDGWRDWLRREAPWLAALAFGLFAAPVVEGFQLGQAYILLLGLHTLAWWGLSRDSGRLTGGGLALALVLKTSGAPLWLLLGARRKWGALAWGGLVCLLTVGLTLPYLGLDIWQVYLSRILREAGANPSIAVTAFQSLPGFWAHLFRYDSHWNPAPLFDAPLVAATLTGLSVLAVLGLTLALTRQAPLPLAFGAMAAAGIFVVPFAEQHHYTLAVLPVFVAAGQWARLGRRPAGDAGARAAGLSLCLALLLIGLPLPYEAVPLSRGAVALLAYPRLYGGLLLWGVLLHFAAAAAAPPGQAGGAP